MPYPSPNLYPEPTLYPSPLDDQATGETGDPARDMWIPTPTLVARILRARLIHVGGVVVDDFDSSTRPTRADVEDLITMHAPLVLMRVGPIGTGHLHCADQNMLRLAVATIIAQRVAVSIEQSFVPEEFGEFSAANTDAFRQEIEADIANLVTAIERCRASDDEGGDGGESHSRTDPAWLFAPPIRMRY